jgi:hypothetical protein
MNSPTMNRLREALKKDFESRRDFLRNGSESAVPCTLQKVVKYELD